MGRDLSLIYSYVGLCREKAKKMEEKEKWVSENYHQPIGFFWSGREDSNFRPLAPHASTLPGCATPRRAADYSRVRRAFASLKCGSLILQNALAIWCRERNFASCLVELPGCVEKCCFGYVL